MEANLIIKTNRTGYGIDQCGKTLTVKELKEVLEDYDDDLKIYLSFDNGYTFGEINSYDFFEQEPEEEY